MPGVYWLNINDRDLPFLALVEHTNFLPPADYGGLHLVYLGNYLPMDHPLFGQSDDEVVDTLSGGHAPHPTRLRPRAGSSSTGCFARRSRSRSSPPTTCRRLPPHRTPLPGVYLANMAHVYPQDRGQNYSLRLGERMARHAARRSRPSAT